MAKKNKKKQKERAVFHVTVGDVDFRPSKKELDYIAALFKEASVDDSFIVTDSRICVPRIK